MGLKSTPSSALPSGELTAWRSTPAENARPCTGEDAHRDARVRRRFVEPRGRSAS